jgi:hypothetical protein
LSLALIEGMGKGRSVIVETFEQDDSMLSIDEFDGLLPKELDAEAGDSLDVMDLHALLPARKVVAEPVPAAEDPALDAGMASDYFSEGARVRQTDARDDLFFLSETRRAALEFERFAEEFHAFARECLGR